MNLSSILPCDLPCAEAAQRGVGYADRYGGPGAAAAPPSGGGVC